MNPSVEQFTSPDVDEAEFIVADENLSAVKEQNFRDGSAMDFSELVQRAKEQAGEQEQSGGYLAAGEAEIETKIGKLKEQNTPETAYIVLDAEGRIKDVGSLTRGKQFERLDIDNEKQDFMQPKGERDVKEFEGIQSFTDKLLTHGYIAGVNEKNNQQGCVTALQREILIDGHRIVFYEVHSYEGIQVPIEQDILESDQSIIEKSPSYNTAPKLFSESIPLPEWFGQIIIEEAAESESIEMPVVETISDVSAVSLLEKLQIVEPQSVVKEESEQTQLFEQSATEEIVQPAKEVLVSLTDQPVIEEQAATEIAQQITEAPVKQPKAEGVEVFGEQSVLIAPEPASEQPMADFPAVKHIQEKVIEHTDRVVKTPLEPMKAIQEEHPPAQLMDSHSEQAQEFTPLVIIEGSHATTQVKSEQTQPVEEIETVVVESENQVVKLAPEGPIQSDSPIVERVQEKLTQDVDKVVEVIPAVIDNGQIPEVERLVTPQSMIRAEFWQPEQVVPGEPSFISPEELSQLGVIVEKQLLPEEHSLVELFDVVDQPQLQEQVKQLVASPPGTRLVIPGPIEAGRPVDVTVLTKEPEGVSYEFREKSPQIAIRSDWLEKPASLISEAPGDSPIIITFDRGQEQQFINQPIMEANLSPGGLPVNDEDDEEDAAAMNILPAASQQRSRQAA